MKSCKELVDKVARVTAPFLLREFTSADAAAANAVALAAFAQYRRAYTGWSAFSRSIGWMSASGADAEIILAVTPHRLAGAVAYVGPGRPKAEFFPPESSIVRMLVVHPHWRGLGIGRALAEECIERARRDGAATIALHTAHIMTAALVMYRRIGFEFAADAPAIHGMPSAIYIKRLEEKRETLR